MKKVVFGQDRYRIMKIMKDFVSIQQIKKRVNKKTKQKLYSYNKVKLSLRKAKNTQQKIINKYNTLNMITDF